MSSVIVNKVGLDLVDLNIEQTGDATTDMFFQEPLLDHTRDYVVAISELSVPLGEEPMLSNIESDKNKTLGYIRRKSIGGTVGDANSILALAYATLRTDRRLCNSPADLCQIVSKFFYTFWRLYGQNATNEFQLIRVGHTDNLVQAYFTCSGIVTIAATKLWWNNFYFEFTPYGIEILGFNKSRLAKVGDTYYLQYSFSDVHGSSFAEMISNGEFIMKDPLPADEIPYRVEQLSDHSIFRYAEHRLRIEVDADLSIPSNILIENGKQKMHYNIGSYAIAHEYSGEITISSNNLLSSNIKLQTPIYIGNTVVKSKIHPNTDWYTVVSSANVQNMRLNIIVLRREWNRVSNKWELVRSKLNIDPKAAWTATLKFVQTF